MFFIHLTISCFQNQFSHFFRFINSLRYKVEPEFCFQIFWGGVTPPHSNYIFVFLIHMCINYPQNRAFSGNNLQWIRTQSSFHIMKAKCNERETWVQGFISINVKIISGCSTAGKRLLSKTVRHFVFYSRVRSPCSVVSYYVMLSRGRIGTLYNVGRVVEMDETRGRASAIEGGTTMDFRE